MTLNLKVHVRVINVGTPPFLDFFYRKAVPLHTNWTFLGSGVTKSIPVDDSHLSVDVPSDYPERGPSVASRGVQPEMVGPAGVL